MRNQFDGITSCQKHDGRKNQDDVDNDIPEKFREIIDLNDDKRVFSCGSGITACVLGLAYSLVNNTYSPTVYDGSWAEYGRL